MGHDKAQSRDTSVRVNLHFGDPWVTPTRSALHAAAINRQPQHYGALCTVQLCAATRIGLPATPSFFLGLTFCLDLD